MNNTLSALGYPLNDDPQSFGHLEDATALLDSPEKLKAQYDQQGYLFFKRFFCPDRVTAIHQDIADRLGRGGFLARKREAKEMVAAPGRGIYQVMGQLNDVDGIQDMVRGEKMMRVQHSIFGEAATPLNHVCPRVVGPGRAEPPHCDIVYMGRGSSRVSTSWMPVTPVPKDRGGLMLLEGSHRIERLRDGYCKMDVDQLGILDGLRIKHGRLVHGGRYTRRPDRAISDLGGRWLSADYEPGDLVMFDCHLLHGTLDNNTSQYRVSIDARYQPSSDPLDNRWTGNRPVAHSSRDWNVFSAMDRMTKRVRHAMRTARVMAAR